MDKYRAENEYLKNLEELKADPDIFSKEDPGYIVSLYREGLSPDYKDKMKKIGTEIEGLKVKLYDLVKEKGDAKEIRSQIVRKNEELMSILRILHCKDDITAEGMAEVQKAKYLLRKSLNVRVDESTLDRIAIWLGLNYITEAQYREVARSTKLNNYMVAGNPFHNEPLTEEQLNLVYWHTFYKNVGSHPEKPFDWVIEDDWALDGWCIVQSESNKRSEAEQYVEGKMKSDAVRSSSEVYIPREPGKDMSEVIEQANSPAAKAYKAAKFAMINRGTLNESADIKLAKSL